MSGPENNKLPDARPALAYIDDDTVRRPRSLNKDYRVFSQGENVPQNTSALSSKS
jgi:hypothetical protein